MVGLPDFRNPDNLQPNLFLTILNPDLSGFQIPIVLSLQQHTTFSFQESPTVPSRLGTGWTGKFPYANAINFFNAIKTLIGDTKKADYTKLKETD